MTTVFAFLSRKPLLFATAIDATFAAWVLNTGWGSGVQTAAVLACKAWTAWFSSSLTTSIVAADARVEQATEVAKEQGVVAGKEQGAKETVAAIASLPKK